MFGSEYFQTSMGGTRLSHRFDNHLDLPIAQRMQSQSAIDT